MAYQGWVFRLGDTQTVSFTSTSTATTTASHAGTNVVRLFATTNCHVKIAKTPTATVNDAKLSPGVEYFFTISPGEKVAAIRTTTSGSLFVTEVS